MSLARFAIGRMLRGALFALVVASLTLVLARLAPGSGRDDLQSSPDEVAQRRAELGLDRPLAKQYLRWIGGLARFDLGHSAMFQRPVATLVGERMRNTAILAVAALIVATAIGLPLGRLAGSAHGPVSRMIRAASLALLSVPPLLSALLFVYLAAKTRWLPIGGMSSASLSGATWFADVLRHLPVPTLALALPLAATLERLQARSIGDALCQPFVAASRARGLDAGQALRIHAWPVSLAPVLGSYGVLVGALFSGSFIVEVVTSWPGLGRLLFDALRYRDVWLVAGCGAAGAAALAIGTTLADIVHAAIDPRLLDESPS